MTIAELKRDLSDALSTLDRDKAIAAARVERWAVELERTQSDRAYPGSWLFSAKQLRLRAAKGNMESLRTEIKIVRAKLEHWIPDVGQ